MRQRRDFDAHVLEVRCAQNPGASFSGRKKRILQIRPTPAITSAFAPASIRKVTPRSAFDGERIPLARNLSAWSWFNEICHYRMHLVEAVHVFVCYQNLSTRSTARIFRATKKVQGSFSGSNKINGNWLKQTKIQSGVDSGIDAARREIT
ncbi:hypothetical protein [uncultured Desulfovibrio sp.]|nr:hypothetical protein [uncultured Desulfovibrio sp.]